MTTPSRRQRDEFMDPVASAAFSRSLISVCSPCAHHARHARNCTNSSPQVRQLMNRLDTDHTGLVEGDEFVAALIDW